MLKKLSQWLLGILLVSALSLPISNTVFAQENAKDQLWLIHEETAKVDMISQYIKTSKDWAAMMHEGGLPINFFAFQRSDLHFYYVSPLSSYAAIDSMPVVFQDAIKKIGKDKWSKLMDENNASILSNKDFIIERSSALSYVPKTPRITLDKAGFVHWGFIHYKLDKRQEVMKVLKDWKALYEKYNFPDAYDIFLMGVGGDNNEIIIFDYANNASDYYKNDSDKSKEMKEEEGKLFGEITPYLINMEDYSGRPRHDLNYVAN
jgi:hypothetical protein